MNWLGNLCADRSRFVCDGLVCFDAAALGGGERIEKLRARRIPGRGEAPDDLLLVEWEKSLAVAREVIGCGIYGRAALTDGSGIEPCGLWSNFTFTGECRVVLLSHRVLDVVAWAAGGQQLELRAGLEAPARVVVRCGGKPFAAFMAMTDGNPGGPGGFVPEFSLS